METETEIILQPVPDPTSDTASMARALPFSFAKRHGVVVTAVAEDRATVTHRPGISRRILAELRRVLKVPVTLVPVTEERFDEALTAAREILSAMPVLFAGRAWCG